VNEETGLDARIVRMLDTIEYFFRAGDTVIHKRVDFYLMLFTGGELRPQLSEVDDVEWVLLPEAIERASFDSEKKLLETALLEIDSLRSASPSPS
ncbi:MAG: hydrolase, partial [Acidobacteria bacterium]|nr:hydrolase [Acidobacteriota bacterium]